MSADIACPICEGRNLIPVLTRHSVPVHQNLVFKDQTAAVQTRRGDLIIEACEQCGFVFNRAFDPNLLAYGAQYDNTQTSSPFFQEYVDGLVRHMLQDRGVQGATVVEVGCGKGTFLRALVADEHARNSGIGFDPSYVGPDRDLGGRLRFERRFYDASCAEVGADVVVSRHVIEHVQDPLGFLRAIAATLHQDAAHRVFLETPSVDWILRNAVVWDLFYEHCSLFSANSLSTACERAGLTVEHVQTVFGEQYLWLEANAAQPRSVRRCAADVPNLALAFWDMQTRRQHEWSELLAELSSSEIVAVWGAGAKGVTFANLVDPDREMVTCLVDMNPAKQGAYVAGTGHPIVGPAALAGLGVTYALLLNPNYELEVQSLLEKTGSSVKLMSIGAG